MALYGAAATARMFAARRAREPALRRAAMVRYITRNKSGRRRGVRRRWRGARERCRARTRHKRGARTRAPALPARTMPRVATRSKQNTIHNIKSVIVAGSIATAAGEGDRGWWWWW